MTYKIQLLEPKWRETEIEKEMDSVNAFKTNRKNKKAPTSGEAQSDVGADNIL